MCRVISLPSRLWDVSIWKYAPLFVFRFDVGKFAHNLIPPLYLLEISEKKDTFFVRGVGNA